MGDPRKNRKKYETPRHPWQKERILLEHKLRRKYGLKNKKEIWKAETFLTRAKDVLKSLIPIADTPEGKKEVDKVIGKLVRLGIVKEGAHIDDVLGLTVESVLERRLQTIVYKKGLARSVRQARQMVVHGHIKVGDKKVTSPSYLVKLSEEDSVTYAENSPFFDAEHPLRKIIEGTYEEKTNVETNVEAGEVNEEVKEEVAQE